MSLNCVAIWSTLSLFILYTNKFRRDPVRLQLRRAGFHPSHRVGQIGLVFLGRGNPRRHRRPVHSTRGFVCLLYAPPDLRHHLGSLREDRLGDARGADGRGDTGEVGHLLTSFFHVDRLGVHRLLTVGRGVEAGVGHPENHALLGV